jgi:hypothetical protein
MQSASVIGELWVTYRIQLLKPILEPDTAASNSYYLGFGSNPGSTSTIASSYFFPPNVYSNSNWPGATVTSTAITLPNVVPGQCFSFRYYFSRSPSGAFNTGQPNISLTGADYLIGGSSSNPSVFPVVLLPADETTDQFVVAGNFRALAITIVISIPSFTTTWGPLSGAVLCEIVPFMPLQYGYSKSYLPKLIGDMQDKISSLTKKLTVLESKSDYDDLDYKETLPEVTTSSRSSNIGSPHVRSRYVRIPPPRDLTRYGIEPNPGPFRCNRERLQTWLTIASECDISKNVVRKQLLRALRTVRDEAGDFVLSPVYVPRLRSFLQISGPNEYFPGPSQQDIYAFQQLVTTIEGELDDVQPDAPAEVVDEPAVAPH